jgi:hypothetical protein
MEAGQHWVSIVNARVTHNYPNILFAIIEPEIHRTGDTEWNGTHVRGRIRAGSQCSRT